MVEVPSGGESSPGETGTEKPVDLLFENGTECLHGDIAAGLIAWGRSTYGVRSGIGHPARSCGGDPTLSSRQELARREHDDRLPRCARPACRRMYHWRRRAYRRPSAPRCGRERINRFVNAGEASLMNDGRKTVSAPQAVSADKPRSRDRSATGPAVSSSVGAPSLVRFAYIQ